MDNFILDSHSAWRQLDREWQEVQYAWHDKTTDYFAGNFWGPLEQNMAEYLRVVEHLSALVQEIETL